MREPRSLYVLLKSRVLRVLSAAREKLNRLTLTLQNPRRLFFHVRSRRNAITWFLCCNLLLALYYDWFRYPFRIGDSGNSPTSRNTPSWISAGKYLIFLSLGFIVLQYVVSRRKPIRLHRSTCVLAYIYLSVMGSAYGLACLLDKMSGTTIFLTLSLTDLNRVQLGRFFSLSLFLLAAILLHVMPTEAIDLRPIYKILRIALIIYLSVDAFQVLLFVLVGRLPAHGYEGSILVRFGSLMDQPNEFGIVLPLFFGIAIRGQSRTVSKVIMILLLSAALVLTLSFTAWIAAPIAVALYVMTVWSRGSVRAFKVGIVLTSVGVMAITLLWVRAGSSVSELYGDVWVAKSDSADAHQHSTEALARSFGAPNMIGLEPNYVESNEESGYVDMLVTEGGVYLLIYISIIVYALFRCALVLRARGASSEQQAVAASAFCFLSAILISGLGLPIQQMFPLNLLTALLVGLINSGALERGQTTVMEL